VYIRKVDISVLGDSIKGLPVSLWEKNMFLFGAQDTVLFELTNSFPATFRKDKATHPLFVLYTNQLSRRVCPCTTKGSVFDKRFIEKGCTLDGTKNTMDKRSYLVESCHFTVPLSLKSKDLGGLKYHGKVPESCISDIRRK
jgi:hypothetical protein